jgi:hypothetical protein
MQPTLPNLPPVVATALERLRDELDPVAGADFAGLILYGGLARGRYRPGRSDVNVVVLLRNVSATTLRAIAPCLRRARRAAGVVPLILMPEEVAATALVFPTKFLDIKDHHIVLSGEDPFATLEIPRPQLSWRIVQELRNLTLRLRHRFIAAVDDPDAQSASLAAITRPMALEMIALLRLAGKPLPSEDRTAEVFQAAEKAFELDGEALRALAALRQGDTVSQDLHALFGKVLTVLARLTEVAERLKEAP